MTGTIKMTFRDDKEHDATECFGECPTCIERGTADGCEVCARVDCTCAVPMPSAEARARVQAQLYAMYGRWNGKELVYG